jgi:hypothetical protein
MRETWVLKNWKECGFRSQPYISRFGDCTIWTVFNECRYGINDTSLHISLRAAKSAFRSENSVRGKTPRFVWEKQANEENHS